MNTTVSVACAVQALVVRLGDPDGSVEEAWHSCYASVIIHPQADLYSEKRHPFHRNKSSVYLAGGKQSGVGFHTLAERGQFGVLQFLEVAIYFH